MIPTEKLLEDAEVAAIYLRALLDKDVPIVAAIAMTNSYTSTRLIVEAGQAKPKEPWADPDA